MLRDIRETSLFRESEALYHSLRKPNSGAISDAADVSAHKNQVVFTGTLADTDAGSSTRICLTELRAGETRVLTFGPNTDRLPRFSPNGRHVTFLSDRHKKNDFQLYLLDPKTGIVDPAPFVQGWVEYFHWSPKGDRILLGTAGYGADIAGVQGAVASQQGTAQAVPSWIPKVELADESHRWRKAWIFDLPSNQVRPVGPSHVNIWEAVWCGNEAIAAVVSHAPKEQHWYEACLSIIDIHDHTSRQVLLPQYQIGLPAASPSGLQLAAVEALCSDRGLVAGELVLIDSRSSAFRKIPTAEVDITYTEWRSERELLVAGHRGFDTVIGLYEAVLGTFREVWCSGELSTGGAFVTVAGWNKPGDCVLVGESFLQAPEIAVIEAGVYRRIRTFELTTLKTTSTVDQVRWEAPDGLEIQGWLLRPAGKSASPLITIVHGGPVWHMRPRWLGRASFYIFMLLARGYAVFFPNPRGSAGRGQAFAHCVVGDMGGADTYDILSGLDYLVGQGIANSARLGVTGGSYGGFMTSWLITQDSRFAAAVPISPVTNQVTQHLLSNIPTFVSMFLEDTYSNPTGKYFQRSPIMYAHQVKTPTLNICGALDRCTPPEEAVQFHNALLENGVKSVLVTYPEEGHGIRNYPALVDFAARIVAWFEEHLEVQQ